MIYEDLGPRGQAGIAYTKVSCCGPAIGGEIGCE